MYCVYSGFTGSCFSTVCAIRPQVWWQVPSRTLLHRKLVCMCYTVCKYKEEMIMCVCWWLRFEMHIQHSDAVTCTHSSYLSATPYYTGIYTCHIHVHLILKGRFSDCSLMCAHVKCPGCLCRSGRGTTCSVWGYCMDTRALCCACSMMSGSSSQDPATPPSGGMIVIKYSLCLLMWCGLYVSGLLIASYCVG